MPRSCAVCDHPDREEIDRALVGGQSSAEIAGRYRTIGERAIRRHKANHLPAKLVMAQAAEEVAQADTLLDQVRDLQRRALEILDIPTAAIRTCMTCERASGSQVSG